MQRYGSVIKVRPGKLALYKRLHAAVWPDVLKTIKKCHIRNYSIYYRDGLLFSYYEYTGRNHAADMKKLAADPATRKWWSVCRPCLKPLKTVPKGQWSAMMEEIFRLD